MSLIDKLEQIILRFEGLTQKLMDPSKLGQKEFATTSKERAELEEVVELARFYKKTVTNIEAAKEIINDNDNDDAELCIIAQEELRAENIKLGEITEKLKIALLPKDRDDQKNAIIEIRAGTGGAEAALFAAVLLKMYHRYAEKKRWKFEIIDITETGLDGCKEVFVSITGKDVFANMKFESGVHRVQRIPETESNGRIHTSAATVAVLPEAEEIDIKIDDKDLRIDVYRSSGAGGQHVNTTDSAVRITHLPTGVVVCQQSEKSQHQNKAKAMMVLRARIYEQERSRKAADRSQMRKGQIGSGDRSERIRTYNYPQSRVTDHRINLTRYNLDNIIMNGELDEFIRILIAEDQATKLINQTSL